MSILPQALLRLCRKGLEACLPGSCLLCGSDSEGAVCTDCAVELPILPDRCCPLCAQPTSRGERCGQCLANPPHFDGTTALFRYDFPLDRLIHALKYEGQLALAEWFGRRLAQHLPDSGFDRLIPLPLHPTRLRERGFNQATEIARRAGRMTGLPVDIQSCHRHRANQPQAQLSLSERAANLRGIFECVNDLSGQRILLLDDVMTSGATLNECARVLKLHGATSVHAMVVARALLN